MRRFAAILILAAILTGYTPPARAESSPALQVEIDYEGAWVSFGQERFKIYLPADWVENLGQREPIGQGFFHSPIQGEP